jgi:hypothetical protein
MSMQHGEVTVSVHAMVRRVADTDGAVVIELNE